MSMLKAEQEAADFDMRSQAMKAMEEAAAEDAAAAEKLEQTSSKDGDVGVDGDSVARCDA